MNDQVGNLRLDENIFAAPPRGARLHIETIKEQYGLTDVVKLNSNENPLGPSPRAVAAIREALPELSRYPAVGAAQLRQGLAARLGRELTSENFFTGNGASEVLTMIVQGFLGQGDESIICRPTFPMYETLTRRHGGTPVWADLDADFCYNVDRVLAAITDRTRLIFICCPNNPTGMVMTPARADRLVHEVPPGVVIVFDEPYRAFATDVEFPDTLRYMQQGRDVIVTSTFSKVYGLAGLRVGYAVARQEIARHLRRFQHTFHHSRLMLRGALAALDDDEHVRRTQELVTAERDWLQARLGELGLFHIPSQTSFITLRPGYPAQTVYERMLQQGVIIRPLERFYMPDFIRVTVGTRSENERFLEVLKKTLAELNEMPDETPLTEEQARGKAML